PEARDKVRGYEVALAVVVAGVAREHNTQSVSDGDPGRHHEEPVREPAVLWVRLLVQRVPCDQHRHDDGLAGARRHLVCDAKQPGVVAVALVGQKVGDPRVSDLGRNLGGVDGRLQGLYLTEEEWSFPIGLGPVLEQATSGGSHALPTAHPPEQDALADAVDVLADLDAIPRPLGIERELPAALLRGRNWNEVRAGSTALNDLVGDPVVVEAEVTRRLFVRRVEDRV